MHRDFLRVVIISTVVAAVAAGCLTAKEQQGGSGDPVALPPTRSLATATPSPWPSATPMPSPSPFATPMRTMPTMALAPQPSPTPTPVPGPTSPVEGSSASTEGDGRIPIGQISREMVGQEVTIEGVVVEAASLRGGFKFTLADESGQVVLLMWHPVYDDCWDAPVLNVGARVRATGEVGQYEEVLQVVPAWGGAVQVLEPAAGGVQPRTIGSLSGADEHQRVMVEGEVIRTEGCQEWVKVFLDDGTGEIVVFLWRDVLDRIPYNTALGTPGSRARVVGTVTVYRSNLEIVPTLPYDVMVLEGP